MKRTTKLLHRLKEIVAQEPWDVDELVDWAGRLLSAHDDDFWEQEDKRRR